MRGRILGSKNKSLNLHKHKFCPQNHDKDVVGRRPNGTCAECAKWANRVSRQNPAILVRHKAANRVYWWRINGYKNEDGSFFDLAVYDRMYQIQQGRCAICKMHQSELKRVFDVDHSHVTGIVRGLLCHGCNMKVGSFESPLAAEINKYLGR